MERSAWIVMILILVALATLSIGCGGGTGVGVSPARIVEYPVPVANSWPDDLAGDAAGNVWFAMHHADEIGRMTPTGAYTGFPVPTHGSEMDSVVVDNARRIVWVSEIMGNNIVRLDMDTGVVTEIPVPTPSVFPGDLALAPDGTLWFVESYDTTASGKRRLGKVDPATNAITEIAQPWLRNVYDGILVDAGGAVWFAEFTDNRIGRYSNGTFTEFPMPQPNSYPTNLAIDPAGRIWVTAQGVNTLAAFNPASQSWVEHSIPTPFSLASGVAADGAGNVWFTETQANRIGVLPAGSSQIFEYRIPTAASYPEDIHVIGNRIYFSERYGNQIGWITVSGITP